MPTSRRSVLAAGAASAAALASPATAASLDETVASLVRRSAEANAALMRGDTDAYRALIPLAPDFTLMAPFGGEPSQGGAYSEEDWARMGRFFRNGTLTQDVVETWATPTWWSSR
jgi:opacity protein-like surface antigen